MDTSLLGFLFLKDHLRRNARTRNGCRIWAGSYAGNNPYVVIDGERYMVRRLVYLLHEGRLTPHQNVRTRCTTRGCVEPSHLFTVE